jgi:hypothetical protein
MALSSGQRREEAPDLVGAFASRRPASPQPAVPLGIRGSLPILAGLGLALGNWLSVFACLVLPLPALAWRIRVEEAELSRVLGHAYRAYRTRTARLIPGLW